LAGHNSSLEGATTVIQNRFWST